MRPALSPRAPRRPRSRSRGFFFSGRRLGRQKRLRGRLRQLVHELPDALAALYGPLELFEPGLGDVDGVVPPVRPPLEVVVGTLTLRRLRRRCLVRQAQTAWCGAEVGITMRASAGRRITTASFLRTATPALASASCALPDCGKHVRSGSRAAPEFDARNDTCYYIAHLGHPRKQMKGKQR